ncbi:MAG: hypothetical protein ACRD3V_08005 [Vicinamibacteria bacterium]
MKNKTEAALLFTGILLASASSALAQAGDERRFEIGGQLAVTDVAELDSNDLGFGGRIGFRPGSLCTFEGELNVFPSDIPDDIPVTGSRLEGLFGVKIGPSFDKFSVFGKVRPGFVRFGESPEPIACILIFPPPLSCILAAGQTVFALDLGGGLEFHPTERSLLRFDVSDLMLRYRAPVLNRDREAFTEGGFWGHNLKLSIGAGFRF